MLTVNGPVTHKCKHCQLYAISKETSALKLKFYVLLESVIRKFTENGVHPEDILKSLPYEIASQMEGAATIKDIFSETGALDGALSWYSFKILEDLVNQLGDTECKQKIEDYIKALQFFLHSRKHDPSLFSKLSTLSAGTIMIQVDPEWDEKLVKYDSDMEKRAFIATLLGTTKSHVTFIQV